MCACVGGGFRLTGLFRKKPVHYKNCGCYILSASGNFHRRQISQNLIWQTAVTKNTIYGRAKMARFWCEFGRHIFGRHIATCDTFSFNIATGLSYYKEKYSQWWNGVYWMPEKIGKFPTIKNPCTRKCIFHGQHVGFPSVPLYHHNNGPGQCWRLTMYPNLKTEWNRNTVGNTRAKKTPPCFGRIKEACVLGTGVITPLYI